MKKPKNPIKMDLKLLPNNAMTFTENQHGNAVLEKLRQQRELVRCCDVILHVNNKQFYAHRCVLSACSPFFDSLFKASKTVKEQLNINADSSEVFHILLAYMYTGTVIVDKKNVAELLKLANKLLLSKLKEYCAEYLQRYLDIHNCLTVLEMANKYGLESLQKTANSLITAHISKITEGEEILELPPLRLENFIKNPNWCLSHEEILTLIISWVHHNLESREASFRSLLTWISWSNINPESVIKVIQEHALFSSSRKCRSFIVEVLNENSLLCQPSYERLTNLNEKVEENGGSDEDSDKLLNLAISTAIEETLLNEPNVDKYLMDTGRELLRGEFPSSEQLPFDPRDVPQNKIVIADFHQYAYECASQNAQGRTSLVDSMTFQPNSCNSQNFEIEEFYKYNIENMPKQKASWMDGSGDEQTFISSKVSEYENHSQCSEPPNCYHYRDYRDTEHLLIQNAEKCPRMTNKVSYMNHKYDANYSNQLVSSNDFSYQKNGPPSDMFAASLETNLKKENSVNVGLDYSTAEYLLVPVKQESQCQALSLSATNVHKKGQIVDGISSQAVVHNSLLYNHVSLNPLTELKSNSYALASSHSQVLNTESPESIQSPNSLPQDMSLSHLKLSEGKSFAPPQNNKNKFYVSFENSDDAPGEGREDYDVDPIARDQNQVEHSCCNESEVVEPFQMTETESTEMEQPNELTTNLRNSNEVLPQNTLTQPSDKEANLIHKASKRKVTSNSRRLATKKSQKKEKVKTPPKDEGKTSSEKKNTPKELRTCDICNATFDHKKFYFAHMTSHFPGPPYHCDICMSTFKRIYYLLDHRHTHSEKKPFKCSQCSFTSRRLFNLKEHMILHTKERPFKCGECGDTFRRKQHLAIHRTKHTNDKPYICEKCGWPGKTKNILLCHSKIHTGDLYSCKYESCAYRTPKKSHLKEHMQYHTKSRLFACKVCDSRFISKYHLQRHLRKHESPNLCQCPHCDYFSSRQDALKIHIERKHSATKPKLRHRKGQLKKKDALLTNGLHHKKETPNSIANEQTMFSTLHPGGCHLSLNSTLPPLSAALPHYPSASSPPSSYPFGTPGDPDDPLAIVSEIEDDNQSLSSFHQGPYLEPSMGHAFSGLLDGPCGSGTRFAFPSSDDLYYNEV